MKVLSYLIFIPLQMLFLPLAIIGSCLVAYRQLVISKREGISQTAVEVLNGRWTMHIFKLRQDEAAERLASVMPNTSVTGLWLALFPLWLKYRIAGEHAIYPRIPTQGKETIADLIPARTQHFDEQFRLSLQQVDQCAVLGAGYDTRAYGSLFRSDVTFFEVDRPAVQANKLKNLKTAGIVHEHVRFVGVDFEQDDLIERLSAAGFDQNRPSLFLWEGVSLYLAEKDVRQVMAVIRQRTAKGSILLADFYAERMLKLGQSGASRKVLEYTDETFAFSLPLNQNWEQVVTDFAESEGFALTDAYFLGSENAKGPFATVVTLKT